MHLEELRLVNFKNYESEHIQFSARLNCFVGKNGMGKTNLLDAIYYLCMCKNNVGLNDRNVIRQGAEFFRLDGRFVCRAQPERIVAKVIPGKRKEFERNDQPYARLLEHIGLLPVVIIIPDDTALIREGSEFRRRFIDNTLSQLDSAYLQQLMIYNRLLKQRNATLKQFAKTQTYDDALLQILDQQMDAPARAIYEKRHAFIERLSPVFNRFYRQISGEQEAVSIAYHSDLIEGQQLTALLLRAREKDRVLQRTTTGIHRDDLKFALDDRNAKRFASQGQLKSFVLALKLAQYELLRLEKEVPPLLLLDDLFDKLDRHRVEFLIELLLQNEFGQVFITDTHEHRLEEIVQKFDSDFKKFVIENGKILQPA